MCMVRSFDKKTRRVYLAGNFCLILGLTMTVMAGGWRAHHRVLFDSVRGIFLFTAIGLLLWAVRRRRQNCGAADADKA